MSRGTRAGVAALALLASVSVAQAQVCDPQVQSAQDKMRQTYIAGHSAIAQQGYSRRPASFAQMSCLENLMSVGNQSLDVFFKPPALQDLMGLLENFVCEAMTKLLDNSMGSFTQALGGMSGGKLGGFDLGSLTGNGLEVRFPTGAGDGARQTIQAKSLFSSVPTGRNVPPLADLLK